MSRGAGGKIVFLLPHTHTQTPPAQLLRVKAACPSISTVVQFEETSPAKVVEAAGDGYTGARPVAGAGFRLLSLSQVEAMGGAAPLPHNPPSPDDMATICYTSGTTGNPKVGCAMLSSFIPGLLSVVCWTPPLPTLPACLIYAASPPLHQGAVLNHSCFAAALAGILDAGVVITPEDVHISYLPLAHLFERIMQV